MLAMDAVFLLVLRRPYFEQKLIAINCGATKSTKTNAQKALAAAVVYAVMIAIVTYLSNKSPVRAAAIGAAVYAIFDGTLYVMSDHWSASDAIADVAWGTILFAASTFVGSRLEAATHR
jgi:hypothetical protein